MILMLRVLITFWYYAVKLFGVWVANALVDAVFDRLEDLINRRINKTQPVVIIQ
tara:strand:+ start:267 stop:428 length:162 start_codon:yes stop_codon:yes gene_type:complete